MMSTKRDQLGDGKLVSLRWQPVALELVSIRERRREVSPAHVAALKSSFALLGGQLQLQPIVVDTELVLIDGAHRLEAAKQSGWSHIAAAIVSGTAKIDRALLEAEANRVRRSLGVLELEEVWRTHYEPGLRAAAKQRQLEGLRRRSPSVRHPQLAPKVELAESVIGISDNEECEQVASVESLARAAKRITGYSLDTLDKVAQIRALATVSGVSEELRGAAEAGLARLAEPRTSVESVYRALRNLQQRPQGAEISAGDAQALANETALERVLSETSLLSERLNGSLSEQVFEAATVGDVNRELLRATRVALTHSLAVVVSLECTLEAEPTRALQRIGAEVTQLLAKTSRSGLDRFSSFRKTRSASRQTADQVGGRAVAHSARPL